MRGEISLAKQAAALIPEEKTRVARPAAPLRHQIQDREILRVIRELGLVAKALPRRKPGNIGAKAKVRAKVNLPVGIFDKAWQRLRGQGDIHDPS